METHCALRLCIAQVHGPAVTFNAQTHSYFVSHTKFSRVRVAGVLVKRNNVQLKLDDGTGSLDVKVESKVSFQNLQLGALVECIGSLEEPQPPSIITRSRRWLNAIHVHEIHDRNAETLKMLETIHMYKTDYAVRGSSPPAEFELLAFPSMNEDTTDQTSKEDFKDTIDAQQRLDSPLSNQYGTASTLVEKPWERQSLGALHPDVDIPPADYQFALPERDQMLIEQGTKSLEIRLNVAPYSIIHVGDRITINGKTLTIVAAIRKYSRLQSVLEAENVNALLPQSSFLGAGTFNAAAAAERHYRQFFSTEEEAHYGLVVFHLAVPLSSSFAPKSQEEWSTLVLRRLEATNDTGCSITDLRFAFPSLSVDQIMDILTNLQFDALVVNMNDKYRLV